jgi:hypothetical protein
LCSSSVCQATRLVSSWSSRSHGRLRFRMSRRLFEVSELLLEAFLGRLAAGGLGVKMHGESGPEPVARRGHLTRGVVVRNTATLSSQDKLYPPRGNIRRLGERGEGPESMLHSGAPRERGKVVHNCVPWDASFLRALTPILKCGGCGGHDAPRTSPNQTVRQWCVIFAGACASQGLVYTLKGTGRLGFCIPVSTRLGSGKRNTEP